VGLGNLYGSPGRVSVSGWPFRARRSHPRASTCTTYIAPIWETVTCLAIPTNSNSRTLFGYSARSAYCSLKASGESGKQAIFAGFRPYRYLTQVNERLLGFIRDAENHLRRLRRKLSSHQRGLRISKDMIVLLTWIYYPHRPTPIYITALQEYG
jgi:hypothetical protein